MTYRHDHPRAIKRDRKGEIMTQMVKVYDEKNCQLHSSHNIPAIATSDVFNIQPIEITMKYPDNFLHLLGANDSRTIDGRQLDTEQLDELRGAADFLGLVRAKQAVEPWCNLHEANLIHDLLENTGAGQAGHNRRQQTHEAPAAGSPEGRALLSSHCMYVVNKRRCILCFYPLPQEVEWVEVETS